MSSANLRAATMTVRLRYRESELVLRAGSYDVGRHIGCDIVIDSALVSRRHARINVGRGSVSLHDLASANGTWLNGRKLGSQAMNLHDGDRVLFGDQEVEVFVDEPPRSTERETSPAEGPSAGARRGPPSSGESTGTTKADFFEVVGKLADRALAEGRPEEAQRVLDAQLEKILAWARDGRSVPDDALRGAVHYAMALARATRSAHYLAYAQDLMTAAGRPPDTRLAAEMTAILETLRARP